RVRAVSRGKAFALRELRGDVRRLRHRAQCDLEPPAADALADDDRDARHSTPLSIAIAATTARTPNASAYLGRHVQFERSTATANVLEHVGKTPGHILRRGDVVRALHR